MMRKTFFIYILFVFVAAILTVGLMLAGIGKTDEGFKRYITVMAFLLGILALTGLFFAWYAVRQWRKAQLKNRVLAKQIRELMIYKEKYEKTHQQQTHPQPLPVSEGSGSWTSQARSESTQGGDAAEGLSTPLPLREGQGDGSAGGEASLDSLSPEELFHFIEHEVSCRLLFLNPSFDRQAIIDEFHISKERVGAAFAQGSKYDSLPQFVNDLRLEYACKLLITTDLPISSIMTKAGFSNASVFSRYFSRKYQITPSQYRRAQMAFAAPSLDHLSKTT